MNPALIGVRGDAIVGNAYGDPYGSFFLRSFAYHFEYPYFIRIGNGKTFTATGITIFLYQTGHYTYCFAGSLRALQGNGHEADIIYYTGCIDKFLAAAKGCFGDGYLVFVDIAHYGIGCLGFGYFAQIVIGVAVDYAAHGTLGVVGCRIIKQTAIHAVVVGIVGDEC